MGANGKQRLFFWAVLLLGTLLSSWMALRSQLEEDQTNQLRFAWSVIDQGMLLPYGVPTSAGGVTPGSIIALVTAAPLALWSDYRAVPLSQVLLHLVTFLLMVRMLRPALGRHGPWLLLALFWLSPWRFYYASHMWVPNYALPVGMLHLITAMAMRTRKSFWITAAHVLVIGLGVQLHSSVVVLAMLSVLLYLAGWIRVHWPAFVLASIATFATLVPWALAIRADPELVPSGEGFMFRGLLLVYPFLKGTLYMLQSGSLSMPSRALSFDFTPEAGAQVDAWLSPLAQGVGVVGHLSLLVVFWGVARLVRWTRRTRPGRTLEILTPRDWLRRYLLAAWLVSLFAYAICPTTIMSWQIIVVMHVAVLTVLLPLEGLFSARPSRARRLVVGWVVVGLLITGLIGVGSRKFRVGGRNPAEIGTFYSDHEMLEALGVTGRCTVIYLDRPEKSPGY